ncbi:uncharacterized protein MYCFIDRAFT_195924 [Pseudocercospora fijiensis CIRAD86]|uniref:Uncharacterized protein n=1 Tax=Pseudocercospora fijiensis (strain CIRAD86) TaxID=383855 RepID=M2Z5F5_PSEFD|nr:uncharacterized protein MYCFIDRAFT_195924 [Pseudocercospora fijiensis CIRAD86]EME85050.1 hypothetical protein MYCFIDRAFT_195924 [Pseudocercospora fijiensis CIRAD86]
MGRMTRAKAAEVAEKLHVDEDAVLELPSEDVVKGIQAPGDNERTPLGEVSVNSAGSKAEIEDAEVKSAPTSKKGGKKGRKGKKKNKSALDASTSSAPDADRDEDIIPDEHESQPSPASRAASQELSNDIPRCERNWSSSFVVPLGSHDANAGVRIVDASQQQLQDTRPNTPPSNAVRLARSQLRSQGPELGPPEPKSLIEEKKIVSKGSLTSEKDATERQAGIQPDLQPQIDTVDIPSSAAGSALDDPFSMPTHVQQLKGSVLVKSPSRWKVGVDDSAEYAKGFVSPVQRMSSNGVDTDVLCSSNASSQEDWPLRSGSIEADSAMASTDRVLPMYDQLENAVVGAATPPRSERVNIPVIPETDPTYDELEAAALSASIPPQSIPKRTSPAPTDAISAMDALEDEVEKINAEVPDVQTSPEKPKTRKVTPVVRTTKASQARISLAHGPKDAPKVPALGRPRQSSARQSSAHAQLSQSTAKRVTSTSSVRSRQGTQDEDVTVDKKEVNIPHSKPRPMSLQFPTPPPPPKSTKAPTKSTFQLPGEAIAAKLKAAKEARLQKEAEESTAKKTFKARPAPSFAKKPPPAVRQTSTSKARESIMNGKPVATMSSKRPHSVATTRPAANKAPVTTKKPSVSAKVAPKLSSSTNSLSSSKKRPVPGVPPQAAKSLTVAKRPSTVMGVLDKPRTSLAPKPNPPATAQKTNGTAKGKEVFSRAAQAKSNAEKEKREKEEAAKKARAAAAERGRQASRDWAEKQRLKKLGLKPETKSAAVEGQVTADLEPTTEIQVTEHIAEAPAAVEA